MHTNSKLLFAKHAKQLIGPGSRVLEIAPDAFPSSYQSIIDDPSVTWETLDRSPKPGLTYVATSDYDFPIADETYDVVLSGQVLEHVPKMWIWICEVARVCKPGGIVVTISPVSWPYHEAPVDCWRTYPDGMRALYEDAGLDDVWSWWGTLEAPAARRLLPGRSPEWQPPGWRRLCRALSWLGLPIEVAYDTITVGRKPDRDER
jgi:SAM-dependent methyltransferase